MEVGDCGCPHPAVVRHVFRVHLEAQHGSAQQEHGPVQERHHQAQRHCQSEEIYVLERETFASSVYLYLPQSTCISGFMLNSTRDDFSLVTSCFLHLIRRFWNHTLIWNQSEKREKDIALTPIHAIIFRCTRGTPQQQTRVQTNKQANKHVHRKKEKGNVQCIPAHAAVKKRAIGGGRREKSTQSAIDKREEKEIDAAIEPEPSAVRMRQRFVVNFGVSGVD